MPGESYIGATHCCNCGARRCRDLRQPARSPLPRRRFPGRPRPD